MTTRPVIFGYLWRAPVMLAGQIAAYPLAPIAAMMADGAGRLPFGLRWLETHDQPGWAGPRSIPSLAALSPRVGLMRWLWRNKAYSLAGMLGIKPAREDVSHIASGGSLVPPAWGPSIWWGVLTYRGRTYWELQPRLSAFGKVAYLRIGWKIIGYCIAEKDGLPWPDPNRQDGMFNAVSPRIKTLERW